MQKKNILGSEESLCWKCDRGKDMCQWEKNLIPVKGWTAYKSEQKRYSSGVKRETTYHVLDCPLFVRATPLEQQQKGETEDGNEDG